MANPQPTPPPVGGMLAVLEHAQYRQPTEEEAADMREARARFAELIAADKEYDEAKAFLAMQRRQVGAIELAEHRFRVADKRRSAALAALEAP